MEALAIRLDAPLMSFGAPIVDQQGKIQSFPAQSMLTGMLGNALGYDHSQFSALQQLQERLRYASRQDRRGQQITDYQTVDLSKPYMDDDRGWTTFGSLEKRKGGTASSGTHVRFRDYWADAVHTVCFTLVPADEEPTLDDLADGLQQPARPLFLGRKPCLPAEPLYLGRWTGNTVLDVLEKVPLSPRADSRTRYRSWWPSDIDDEKEKERRADMQQPVTDWRDWSNQIHVGERWITEGELKITGGRT